MEDNGMKRGGGNFWVGMLVGLAVGAGAAMLYAPKSGAETREMIKDRARQVGESATNTYNRAKSKIAEMRGKAEEKAEELQSKAM
jgi:gas vesicle protein